MEAVGVSVYPTVYLSVHTSSLANVHCSESLVLFEISGVCHAIHTGSSSGLLPVILLLPCVMEILQLWNSRTGPVTHLNRSWMMQILSPGSTWLFLICTTKVSSPVFLQLDHPKLPAAHLHPHSQSQLHCAAQSRLEAHFSKCCNP